MIFYRFQVLAGKAGKEFFVGNEMEIAVVGLITHAGDARSLAIQAIRTAREGDFAQARQLLQQCDEAMAQAHEYQTGLICQEAGGEPVALSLLLVHAQDHVMNAMTVRDLAVEMVAMMETR